MNKERVTLCLSDITKDRISEFNGKKYITIDIVDLKAPDEKGRTRTAYITPTKEEQERKADKIYLGKGKEIVWANPTPSATPTPTSQPKSNVPDDLPW